MDEINFLRKKYFVTPDKMVCEVKDNFTFDEVVKLLREYTEYQASSHKHNVMQQSEQLFCECRPNVDMYQETKIYHTGCNKEVRVIRTK